MRYKGKNITPLRIVMNIAKVLLLIFALRYIYRQIFVKQDTVLLLDQLKAAVNEPLFFLFLIPVLLLMPLNWIVESLKWKILTGKFEKVSFYTCWKAVLTGLCLGIMTPARIGEFAGRVMYLEPDNRLKGIMASFMGSVSQLATTLIFGLISAQLLLPGKFSDAGFSAYLLAVNLILISGFLFFYFFISKPSSVTYQGGESWFSRWLSAARLYDKKTRLKILLMSFLRYIIFTVQFVLLINAFGGIVNFVIAFGHAAMTFLGMTLIPTFALAEAGVRGSIAIEVFGLMEINPLAILSASVLLWVINLMLPTFLGIYYMLRFRLKKSEQ